MKDGKSCIPEVVHRLVTKYKVFLEVAYPISVGKESEYPYPKAQQAIRLLFELVWGSDMPNVERYCAYAQSLNYLKNHCNFLSDFDKELTLGKNVIRIFGLDF